MLKFEYDIKLDEKSVPYIYIPEEYKVTAEDKFMILQLASYFMYEMVKMNFNHEIKDKLDENYMENVTKAGLLMQDISDNIGLLIKGQMEGMGDLSLINPTGYHIQVKTLKERDNLKYKGILFDKKIFKRSIGLKVHVVENDLIYELTDGIDNIHWKKVK